GSINYNVKLAIQHGVNPINAIQMASFSAAECYGLEQKGAIAPGYDADFLLLSDLNEVKIDAVYCAGKLVAKNGKYLTQEQNLTPIKPTPSIMSSIQIREVTAKDLQIPIKESGLANIIEIIPNSIVTNHLTEEVDVNVTDGHFQISIEKDHLKLAVVERHRATGNVGLGIVKGMEMRRGAIATTIAHDSHNIITAGTNDEDIGFAIEKIKEIGGGQVVVDQGKVIASLSLPIAGLLSNESAETVSNDLAKIKKGLDDIGASKEFNPF